MAAAEGGGAGERNQKVDGGWGVPGGFGAGGKVKGGLGGGG